MTKKMTEMESAIHYGERLMNLLMEESETTSEPIPLVSMRHMQSLAATLMHNGVPLGVLAEVLVDAENQAKAVTENGSAVGTTVVKNPYYKKDTRQ